MAQVRPRYEQHPLYRPEILNLVLYYLASGDAAEADRLCREILASRVPAYGMRRAILNRDHLLVVYPEHAPARAMRGRLPASRPKAEP